MLISKKTHIKIIKKAVFDGVNTGNSAMKVMALKTALQVAKDIKLQDQLDTLHLMIQVGQPPDVILKECFSLLTAYSNYINSFPDILTEVEQDLKEKFKVVYEHN